MSPGPARRTRAEIRRRNRDALLDAAARLFAERGFRVATIDDVAHAAGLTKGAVYSHFTNKHELFAATIARRYAERYGAFLAVMSDATLDAGQRTRRAATEFAHSVTADGDWALLFAEAWTEMIRTPGFGAEVRRLADGFRDAVARLVDEQLAVQGQRSPLPAADVAEMVVAISHGFGIAHRLDSERAPAPLFAELMATFATGLAARSTPRQAAPPSAA